MRNNRVWIIVSILASVILATSGCSAAVSDEGTAQTASASIASQQAINSDAIYVQVQSIDNSMITAVVGTVNQPEGQTNDAGQQGTPPDMPSGSDNASQGTPAPQTSGNDSQSAPQKQSDDNSAQGGQGAPGGAGGSMGFTAGDAVITFQVGDTTAVTKQNGPESTEATLEDIAVGDILTVTLSNKNVAESIVIQSSGAGQSTSPQGK